MSTADVVVSLVSIGISLAAMAISLATLKRAGAFRRWRRR